MRIVFFAVGSRGDVAPYTGLGRALAAAGNQVSIATHEQFEELTRSAGLGYFPLPMDVQAALESDSGRAASGTSLRALSSNMRLWGEHYRDLGQAMMQSAAGAELLLLSPLGWLGYHVAEGLGLPSMGVYLQPWTPTAAFPPPAVTTRSLGPWGNRAAAKLMRSAGQWPYRGAVNDLRAELGLPKTSPGHMFRTMEATRWPIWYGYSPSAVPKPKDWPAWHEPVGYWWPAVDPAWAPETELLDFLAAGPPPVFIGFGSVRGEDPEQLNRVRDRRDPVGRCARRGPVGLGGAHRSG